MKGNFVKLYEALMNDEDKLFHGSGDYYKTLEYGGGKLGKGLYFTPSLESARLYNDAIMWINRKDFKFIDGNKKLPKKVLSDLVNKSQDEWWWSDWDQNKAVGKQKYMDAVSSSKAKDVLIEIITDMYDGDEDNFGKVLSKHYDGMFVKGDKSQGSDDIYMLYNRTKVNKLKQNV